MQSDLVVVEEDGEVDYYAFFKLKIDIRTYLGNDYDLKVRKIHEITYAETYESNEELNVPL